MPINIALVRPPSVVTINSYIASITPPIGLAYLAGSLIKAGHTVHIIDSVGIDPSKKESIGNGLILRGIGYSDICNLIPSNIDLIAFSGMFSSEWISYKDLINLISTKFTNTYLIAGGEHFSAAPELSMDSCLGIDAVIRGEGEETIVELANAIEKKMPWNLIPGMVIRGKENVYIKTGNRMRIRALDEIPKPAWDLVPMENYLSSGSSYGVNLGRSMPMIASRGCPYQCTFCSSPQMWGTRWVARSPALLVDEILEYKDKYKISNIDFYDLTAIVKRDWIIDFTKELIKRNVNITWQLPSGTRSEAIDAEVCKLLYESGCRNMNYAPESGSEAVLKEIKKKIKINKMIDSLRSAIKEKINVKMNIIIGFPFEGHIDIIKTLLFLIRLSWAGAHDVSIGVFAPYPGSELYEELVKRGVIKHSDEYWNKLAYVDITETISYSDNVSARMLKFYNFLGFALFYGSNYIFRPNRALRTLKNLINGKHESRGEMALSQILARYRFVLFGIK
jgi:anaerobic magnesium-protoporphyrin IX monomethyl ester cyclase